MQKVVEVISEICQDMHSYFNEHGMKQVVDESYAPGKDVNEMTQGTLYRPELGDLYRLHRLITELRRTTV